MSEAGQLDQLDQLAAASLTLENNIFFKKVAAILLNIVFNTTLSNCSADILTVYTVKHIDTLDNMLWTVHMAGQPQH